MGYAHIDLESRTAHVCGVVVHIEVKAGSYRQKAGKTPVLFSDHYGEICGLLDSKRPTGIAVGADGDLIDCYIGPYPENSDSIYIINQVNRDGDFDEHKVMFGFLDMDHARNVYRNSCHGKEPMSMVSCTKAQFLYWFEHGNHKAPVTAQSFPFDTYSEIAMEQAKEYDWQNTNAAASRVLYDLRVTDSAYGQLNEPMDFETLLDEVVFHDGGDFAVLDALVIPNKQLEKKANQIGMALNRNASGDVKLVDEGGVQVTEPYKQHGTTNVAMLFNFTDGQTVSVFLHNPDSTPNKLTPDDNLVAWKWNLNKKDITIVVAKENGQDQTIMAIAKKVMALVDANSAKFQRANAKAAENEAEIKATEARIEQKKNVLQDLLDQIAAIENGQRQATPPANEPEPDLGFKVGDTVKATWPSGDVVTGIVKSIESDGYNIGTNRMEYKVNIDGFMANTGSTKIELIQVQATPPNDEDMIDLADARTMSFEDFNKQYEEFEENNARSESAIWLAARYGSQSQVDELQNVLAEHLKAKQLTPELSARRDKASKGLYEAYLTEKNNSKPVQNENDKYKYNSRGDDINMDEQTIKTMQDALKELESLSYEVMDNGQFDDGGVFAFDGQVKYTFDYDELHGLNIVYENMETGDYDLLISEREYSSSRQPLTVDQIVKEVVAFSARQKKELAETFKEETESALASKSSNFIAALMTVYQAAQQTSVNVSWGDFSGSYSGGLFDKANVGMTFLESLPKDLDYGLVAQIGMGGVIIGRVEVSEQGEIGVLIGNAGTTYQASGLKTLNQVIDAFKQLKETPPTKEPTPEPTPEPAPKDEPVPEPAPMDQFEKEREFLEQMIAGQLDVMDEPTGDRLMEIAEKFDGSEEHPEMATLLDKAVAAYMAKLDLLSQS